MVRLGKLHLVDRLQLLLAGMLLVLGLMTVYSASTADFRKQLLSLLLGVVAYLGAARVDYRRLERFVLPAYAACLLLLLAVHFAVREGAERRLRTLLGAIALAVPPMVLILLQPDLGTAMVFAALLAGMLFLGGSSRL